MRRCIVQINDFESPKWSIWKILRADAYKQHVSRIEQISLFARTPRLC